MVFHLQKECVRIALEEEDVERGAVVLDDLRSLSQTLLPAIDELFQRYRLRPEDLGLVEMRSEIAPVFTSYRIVEATVKSLSSSIRL